MTDTSNNDDGYSDELIEGHEYDGIREYDNGTPTWLSAIFIATIVWGILYWFAINLGYVNRYEEDLAESQEEIQKLRAQAESDKKEVDRKMLLSAVESEEAIQRGKEAYDTNCISCHGKKLEGTVGPNLTDDHWMHGGSLKDIYKTIKNGVLEKGMPAWDGPLDQEQMIGVVAYIRSKRGSEPKNAKKPEGEEYKPKTASED